MARTLPDEEAIRETAADSEYTAEAIEEAVKVVHDAVQSNLYDHYDSALNSGGPDNLLYEIGSEVFFAFSPREVLRQVKDYDDSFDNQLILLAIEANLNDFQADGRTISISGTLARHRDPPAFYPIGVQKTDEWQRGEAHALQMFEAYTSRAEMSASEALDYWATERMGKRADRWAGFRNVGAEAIRKNRRQAREKVSENGLGSGHENNDIYAVKKEDTPEDGVYDDDEDRYFMPFDGYLTHTSDEE